MTTRRLTIEIAIDSRKAKDVLRGLEDHVEKFGGTVGKVTTGPISAMKAGLLALGSSAVILGIARLSGAFLDAATEAEGYRLRLNGLLGSVEEGNRLFREMSTYAEKTPFEFREIMEAATQLGGVMKGGVDEIKGWMPLIGDLAAAYGMSIQDTTGQVIRMLSAGASAADTFRERGVTAALGFQHGVTYSLEETRRKLIEAWVDPESKFRGMTERLAETWAGKTSMMSDAWFKFRTEVMDQGMQRSLTEIAGKLVELAEDESVQQFARDFGTALASVVGWIAEGIQGYAELKAALALGSADMIRTVATFRAAMAEAWTGVLDMWSRAGETLAQFGVDPRLRAMGAALANATQQASDIIADNSAGFSKRAEMMAQALDRIGAKALLAAAGTGKVGDEAAEATPDLEAMLAAMMGQATAHEVSAKAAAEAEKKHKELTRTLRSLREQVADARDLWREYTDAVEDGLLYRDPGPRPRAEGDRLEVPDEEVTFSIDEEFIQVLLQQGRILERQAEIKKNLEGWAGAAYEVAHALEDVDAQLAKVAGSAGDFLVALTNIGAEGGKVAAVIAGADFARAIGEAVTGPNNYGAEGAAAGSLIGALVGAYFGGPAGAQAGAAIGGAAGGALGSFIKKGVDEFLGEVFEAGGAAVVKMSTFGNDLSQIGKQLLDAISRGVNDAVDALGGELVDLPQLQVKIRDGVYSVFSNGITARFASMQEAVDFAILQALREGNITGLSDEVRAALENSVAESFQAMAADLDFARWVEGLPEVGEAASESARVLDDVVEQYRTSIRKALALGIDTGKIDQWLSTSLAALRNNILGIVETNEERIRREAEAFNREIQILEAEQLAKRADLTIQEANLRTQITLLEAQSEIARARLAVDRELVHGEVSILNAKLEMLAAITEALSAIDAVLAGLPDLINDKDIRDALRRGRGPKGGGVDLEAGRQDIRDEVAGWGLSDVAAGLRAASQFTEQFEERIKDLAFTAEERAKLLAAAQQEEDRLLAEAQNDVRQTYYDAIAQAQGLSEIWGILDKFRDLRQNLLDAGLSAEELAEKLAGVDWAEDVELQRVEFGIVDRLFGFLAEDEAWAEKSLEFTRMKVELEFAVMKGQLQLLGVWAEYAALFDAALAAALAAIDATIDVEPPSRNIRNNFRDAANDADRIRESFARAKGEVAEFLNSMLVGEFGGVSPQGGLDAAMAQFEELMAQAGTGNIGAIEQFDDYAATLLRLAHDAYGSAPDFQAIYDYVLGSGADILGLQTGREGNLVFDERFYAAQQQQVDAQRETNQLLARIADRLSRQSGPIAGAGVNR